MIPVITTNNGKIFRDDKELILRGYNYNNTPIGGDGSYSFCTQTKQMFHDVADIRALGMNCIRAYYNDFNYNDYGTALAAFHDAGINVILFYYLPHAADYSDEAVKETHRLGLRSMMSNLKRYPAIIGWGIGNENNLISGTASLVTVYEFVEELCTIGKTIDANRIFVTAENGVNDYLTYGHLVPSMDVWGFNVYSGGDLGDFPGNVRSTTTKPIILTEFGFTGLGDDLSENQTRQSNIVLSLVSEAESNYPDVAGWLLFQWHDGYYKAGNVSTHDLNAEEWWGHAVAVAPDNDAPRGKKRAYEALKNYRAWG